MAKNKVINTVLTLRDNMSGGLIKAAKNTKGISKEMVKATQQVVAFKNKAVDGIKSFAKTAMGVGVAGASALMAAFLALDGATEEYRIAQGRLNTAYEAAGYGAQTASQAYRDFYGILGDVDTATEASQLLAKLAQSEQDVSTWTRIAAGVSGTFGDSLPIEGLIESANETARVGTVTGTLADALNWVSIQEDDFNERLAACGSEAERNRLIMDTLSQTYETAADAFYRNNEQLVASRNQQIALQEVTAGLGATSATVKTKVLELFGAMADGTVRPGSALDWLTQKAEGFSDWVNGLDMGALATQFDETFGGAVQKAGDAIQWCKENGDLLIGGLKLLAGAFVAAKAVSFTSSLINGVQTIGSFISTLAVMTTATGAQTAATGAATAAQTGLNVALSANPIGLVITLIMGLVAAGIALYKNWDTIKAGASALWGKVKETFGAIGSWISEKFDGIKNAASNLVTSVKNAFGKIKDAIVGAFNNAKSGISGFFSWVDDKIEGIPILGSLYSGGKSLISGVASWIGGNALGTSYWRGGVTRVNERGGEILNLPSGTQIIPHDVSARMAGGPQVTVNVTVAGNVIGNRQYADELGETIVQRILRALDNM